MKIHWMLFLFVLSVGRILYAVEPANDRIEVKVMVVGGVDGGKVEHGKIASADIRFKNISKQKLSVPLAARNRGKEAMSSKREEPSYKSDESWWFAGILAPRIIFRFEDSGGHPVMTDTSVMIADVPTLAPGGWVTASCLFQGPEKPGKYNLRITIDNTNLRDDAAGNEADDDPVYIKEEILLKGLEVK